MNSTASVPAIFRRDLRKLDSQHPVSPHKLVMKAPWPSEAVSGHGGEGNAGQPRVGIW
jgi:hypothetical protein